MNIIFNGLVYFVWFLATFYTVFILLALLSHQNLIFQNKKSSRKDKPLVSILVPAFNEENSIRDTIESLKKVTYRNVEFIILSDGSKDRTAAAASEAIGMDSRFHLIDNKVNKGKAATLNQGISIAKGEFVATMDADSVVEKDILQKVLPYFDEEKTGAVTVSVQVHKPRTFLDKMIAMEYDIGLSLFLKVFSFFDCIFVTPGPFSVYRRSMLDEINGFDPKNITEDLEIAYRIHKRGYDIKNCIEAKVQTKLPEGFRKIFIQRRRWYSGAIKTLYQHKNIIGKPRYRLFGFFMPFNYFLIFLGLILFFFSTYLAISKFITNLMYYRYTDFNFIDHFSLNWDLLAIGSVNLLAMSMFALTLVVMIIGIISLRRRFSHNRVGLFAYPFMFVYYQIFWTGSFLHLLLKRELKWR